MFQAENRSGINLTKDKLQYVELVYYNKKYILDYIDEAYLSEELNFELDKDVKIASVIQNAFNEITAKHRIKSKALFFSLPSYLFSVSQLPFEHTLLEQDLLLQFRWEYDILFPQNKIEECALQFYEVEPGESAAARSAIVSAINRKHIKTLRNFAQKNGFTLMAVDYAHFSCDCTLSFNYPSILDGHNISLFLDDRRVSVELLEQGKPVYYRSMRFRQFADIVNILVADIAEMQKKVPHLRVIDNAFVFGDSVTPVLLDTWEKSTGIHFSPVNPFRKLTISSKLADSRLLREHFYTFAAATGISLRMA